MKEEEKQKRLEEMLNAGKKFERDKKKTLATIEELEARKRELDEQGREKERENQERGNQTGSAAFIDRARITGFKNRTDATLEQNIRGRRKDGNMKDSLE